MSLDDVYDLTEKLDSAKMDYFIVILQKPRAKKKKTETNYKANLFLSASDEDSQKVLSKAVAAFKRKMDKGQWHRKTF